MNPLDFEILPFRSLETTRQFSKMKCTLYYLAYYEIVSFTSVDSFQIHLEPALLCGNSKVNS